MSETRKLAAILVSDVVGYSRLAGADEDRILARLRTLRSDLIDPTIAVHHGRIVKRTGDGSIIEFRSVVDAVRCAIELQNAMVERNAGVPPERRIEFRVGIHVGDVVEEADGDLMGDGVNIAARLEGIAKPGAICLSEDAYRQVKSRLDLRVSDLGPTPLKNIAEPVRVYSVRTGVPAESGRADAAAKRPMRLMRIGVGLAALLLLVAASAAIWRLASGSRSEAPVAEQAADSSTGQVGRRTFRSWFCPSPICRTTRPRTISLTESRRTSPMVYPASTAFSSFRGTRLSPSRGRLSTPAKSARSSASATFSRVRSSATGAVSA